MKAIKCTLCKTELGEIHKAKIRQGVTFLCLSCDRKIHADKFKDSVGKITGDGGPFKDIFGNMF